MANYLVINKDGESRTYPCKTTHTSQPYIKVNDNFLDLTTNIGSGIRMIIERNNTTYTPRQVTTTTVSKSSEYTETTGYSGISSETSKIGVYSGYSGPITLSTFSYRNSYNTVTRFTETLETLYSINCTQTVRQYKSTKNIEDKAFVMRKNGLCVSTIFAPIMSTSNSHQIDQGRKYTTQIAVTYDQIQVALFEMTAQQLDDAGIKYFNTTLDAIGTQGKINTFYSSTINSAQIANYSAYANTMYSTLTNEKYTSSSIPGELVSTTALTIISSRSSEYETITEL